MGKFSRHHRIGRVDGSIPPRPTIKLDNPLINQRVFTFLTVDSDQCPKLVSQTWTDMRIKLPSYLHQNRHGIFGFRVTLKTTEKRLAKHFASGLAVFTATCIKKIRRMKNKAPNTPLIDFLNQFDAERQRIGQNFLDNAGASTPEEQLAAIVEMVEVIPEGPIREIAQSLIALRPREIAIDAKKHALMARAVDDIPTDCLT